MIGPQEIAPEMMLAIKELQNEQKKQASEVQTCRMQFKTLEGLRLQQIQEEIASHEKKLSTQHLYV